MFKFLKREGEAIPIIPTPPPPKHINISQDEFIAYVVDYESGKIDNSDVLIFFCYIVENEKWERFRYPYLIELMEAGVITEEGYVDPYALKNFKT